MKKFFAYFLAVSVFSLALCGCGRDRVEEDNVINTPVVTPMITLAPTSSPSPSPSMMPDKNDGEVNDKNGIIEENDNDTTKDDSVPSTVTPAPSASTKP